MLVTTHLNTEHLHCHFVINSVSFSRWEAIAEQRYRRGTYAL
ncbi:MAG: relaxase/mobilization nuclease domain-containing protein [Acutalibacteraceae bacterium]